MRKKVVWYVKGRLYRLIFIEVVKCFSLSILAATLITLPFMHFVGKTFLSYTFVYFGDTRDLIAELIVATSIIFICLYFSLFQNKIKNLKNDILSYVVKELRDKIEKYSKDTSNLSKLINEINVNRFD